MITRGSFAWVLVGVLMVGGVSLRTSSVRACTQSSCPPPRVFPAQGDLPADQVELRVTLAGGPDAGAASVRIFRLDGDVQTPLDFEMRSQFFTTSGWPDAVFTPRAPLAAGTRLVLEVAAPSCLPGGPMLRTEYRVTEARAAPSTLGAVEVTPAGRAVFVVPAGGLCESAVDGAYVDVSVRLADDAVPFENVTSQSLLVDGARFFDVAVFNAGVVVPGVRRVFAICRSNVPFEQHSGGISVGRHRVRVRGTLINGATVDSDEVEIELDCRGPIPTMVDSTIDAGSLAIVRDAGTGRSNSEGCAAAGGVVGRDGSSSWAICALFLVAALIVRRRRAAISV